MHRLWLWTSSRSGIIQHLAITRKPVMRISLQGTQAVLALLQTLTVLVAAALAAIKFKIFEVWKQRYRTEMQCRHMALPNGETVFIAEYSIWNTGERPISIDRVSLGICRAKKEDGGHLVPDRADA